MKKTKRLVPLILIAVIVLQATVIAYGYTPKRQSLPAQESIITNYIHALSANEWENAGRYLTGEALILHQRNTTNLTNEYKAVVNKITFTEEHLLSENTAIITAISTTSQGENLEETAIRYTLNLTEKGWKISSTELLPENTPEAKNKFAAFVNQVLDRQATAAALSPEEIITKTLTLITQGQWQEALPYLTGVAKTEAQRTLSIGQKPIQSKISDINIKAAGLSDTVAWYEVSYDIEPNEINPQKRSVTMYFKLKNILDQWKIYKIEIVSL